MAELKTKPTDASVMKFLDQIPDDKMRKDAKVLMKLIGQITKAKPRMWGTSLIGFGSYHYRYASGREGDWFLAGFSPRKQNLVVYVMCGLDGYKPLLKKLGKHKMGKSCLYLYSLQDIDMSVLKELITRSVRELSAKKK